MGKFKKITWFAAFCSLLQYTRDRKLGGYIMANLFSCMVPALLLVLYVQGKVTGLAFVLVNVAARLVFAPADEYTSGEYAYAKLFTFPLNIFEMLWIRLVAKFTQVSEWAFLICLGYVYGTLFGVVPAIALTVLTAIALEITEEILFYLMWLVRKRPIFVVCYLAACILVGAASVLWIPELSVFWIAVVWGIVLALSILSVLVLYANRSKIRPLHGRTSAGVKAHMPLSSRLMLAAADKSPLFRLVCMEWICMLKLKLWDMISALGYVVVFSALDKEHSMLYILVQYFIVDYCFLVGFNYFGIINDNEGMFLFSTVDRKTQLRSKNLALATVLLVTSSLITLILGLLTGVTLKVLVLTALANLFCISVMVLCSSLVSITHFHLSESKKKYTLSNTVIMIAILALSSLLTAFLLAGGMLGAISLIFMVVATLACAYFSLVDVSLLADLFSKRKKTMIALLRS